jgi:signal peptidase I
LEEIQRTEGQLERPSAENEKVSLAKEFGGRSILREIFETVLLTIIIFSIINFATGRFQVRGSSMQPTLDNGQYLLIGKLTYWIKPPERGDIIVFHPPTNPREDYIKRIIGLPGETIEIKRGQIWADGILLEEPYITRQGNYSGAWQLGDDEYFVLGDNRNNSSDSHSWGVLPEDNIVGKAWFSYWPPDEWGTLEHYTFPESEALTPD